jgi:hypothetical protein
MTLAPMKKYQIPFCLSLSAFSDELNIFFFAKQAVLTRRSTLQSLPLQQGFHGQVNVCQTLFAFFGIWVFAVLYLVTQWLKVAREN